jgi:DNA-binding NarL/FixJ family response regulator
MTGSRTTEGALERRKILIVDDHPVVRRGLAALIDSDPDLEVCGEAGTCEEAISEVLGRSPDLVIVDIALGREDGLSLVRDMKGRFPAIPTLVLSMHDEEIYGERALRAGASGYVTKQQMDDTVLTAIRQVLRGETFLSPALRERMSTTRAGMRATGEENPLEILTDRELQVFRRIGEGLVTRRIADELQLSAKTVESHCANIKNKLGLRSATELAHCAILWMQSGRTR